MWKLLIRYTTYICCGIVLGYANISHGLVVPTLQKAIVQQDSAGHYVLQLGDQILLTSREPILSPSLSPNGLYLAYVSLEGHQATIYVEDLARHTRRIMTAFPGINASPAWSPDSKKLAFVLSRGDSTKIFTMGLQSPYLKQITYGDGIDIMPQWSLDGHYIRFLSDRAGSLRAYRLDVKTGEVQAA